jgi:serine/threonine protein kinase
MSCRIIHENIKGSKSATHGVGTACWLAPEVINHARSSIKSDVYAFGIVLWECYTRQEVHEGLSAAQIIAKVAHEGLRPRIPLGSPVALANVMSDCWKQDPVARPDFEVVFTELSQSNNPLSFNSPPPYPIIYRFY